MRSSTLHQATAMLAVLASLSLLLATQAYAQESAWKRLVQESESLYGQGRYDQAVVAAKQALRVAESDVGPDQPSVATSLNNLALLYETQGHYAQAEPLYKRALAINEKTLGPEHPDVAASLNNLAGIYDKQGQYALAEPLYRRSLAIKEKVLGHDHPAVATSLSNLAGLYETQGQYAQAQALYRRSLAILEKSPGPDHPDVASILSNLAELYRNQGQYAQAEPLIKRSLAVREKALGLEHPAVAASLNSLAAVYRAHGQYAQAEALYKRSLAIKENTLGPDHPDVATSLNDLAGLYGTQGRYAQAEPFYKRSHAIYEKTFGEDHPAVTTSLGNLAALYLYENRLPDALENTRKGTHILASRIKAAAGNATSQQGSAEASGANTFAFHALLIGKILPTATDRPPLIAEAFAVSQYARIGDTGAALAQMAARASAGSGVLSQKVREQQDAVATWQQLDKQLIDALSKSTAQRNASAEQALRQRLVDTDTRIAALNTELQRDFPEYRELVSPDPLAVADAQQLLGPDEALVTYLVTKLGTLMWVIRPGSAEMIRLEIGNEDLSKQVAMLRQGVDLFGGLPDFPHAAAHALYQNIFAPAVPHLAGVKHVMVVADGPLQSLPFGMLLSTAVPPKAEKNIPWLIRQYAFTNLPAVTSLRALRRFGKKRETSEPFLGFGDPLFNGTREEARGVSVEKLFARGALADTREVSRMARLPETAVELKAIAKTLKAADNTIHLREAATEQQVKQTNLAPYRVLAFATHGLMSGDFKGLAEPALALTPPATASELDDGLLTASEVAGLKLNADWVILSACNTASADGKPGADGFSGLTKAFFYAGSQTLLVSHWAVDSVATVALTTRMITEAEKGVSRSEALRRSMLALIDHPSDATLRHPAMWAPFVVVGEGMAGRNIK